MKERSVEVMGYRLRLMEHGDGPALLFLHGAGGAKWNPLLARLSETCHVIAPEHPGFGRGLLPEWMMSAGDLAFFYLDALEALGLEDVHLVGHSIGGWIAAELAIRSTRRLKSLSLLAPAGIAVPEAPFPDIFAWSVEDNARAQFYDRTLAEQRIRDQANADLDIQLQNKVAVARIAWSPRLHNPQLPYWLHRIDVPTLLIWGIEDRIVPFACHKPFLEKIPLAEIFAVPECGHQLAVERPVEVANRLLAFIEGFKE